MPEQRRPIGVVRPGFAGVYDPEVEYGFYVWVRDGYNSYISTKPSKGIPTSNEDYWFRASDFGAGSMADVGDISNQEIQDILDSVFGGN